MYQSTKCNPKKVSAEFLQALKNTPQLPLKSQNKNSKENYPFKTLQNNIKKETNQNCFSGKVIQEDIRKIAKSYTIDGNILKVIQPIGKNQKQSINYVNDKGLNDYKEIIKLEYLQKKGFLRPQEEAILKRYRSQKNGKVQKVHEKENYKKMNFQPYQNHPLKSPQSKLNRTQLCPNTENHKHIQTYQQYLYGSSKKPSQHSFLKIHEKPIPYYPSQKSKLDKHHHPNQINNYYPRNHPFGIQSKYYY